MAQRGPALLESAIASAPVGYYGQPIVHRPHWKWLVVGYFFFGGLSGASAVIAATSRLTGGTSGARTARIACYVSATALAPCPLLLVLDLGRPRRFLNMLRVFRLSSPMSVGSWGLALFGAVTLLAVVMQGAQDLQAWVGRGENRRMRQLLLTLSPLHALTGFFLAGYTGVLLAATAVPLWSKRPALLAPLFLASAMSSGAAATVVVSSLVRGDERGDGGLRRLETAASVTEGVLLVAWLLSLGPTASPLVNGRLGAIVRHGVTGAGITLPLMIGAAAHSLPPRLRRAADVAASLLTLAGVFALRFAIVEGGRKSADDPRATFEMTG